MGVAVIGSFLVWAYALSGVASQPPPDELDSTRGFIEAKEAGETYVEIDGQPAFAVRAQLICEATSNNLPDASTAASGEERAAQIREANAMLEAMMSQLQVLPMQSERDQDLRNKWLADWTVLVGDRDRHADALELDPAAVFTISAVADGERLERRLNRFAQTNLMLACASPTDVG